MKDARDAAHDHMEHLLNDPRTFLDWNAPLLPAAAARLADVYTRDGVLQLDRVLLVLPGGRAGRRLKELLIQEATRRDVRLVPPRIITPGHLPELLYSPELPLAEPTLCRRVWAHQLRAVDATALTRVFPQLPSRDALHRWLRLAAEVERLHAEVSAGLLTFADVADRCDREMLFDDTARWEVLADLQQRYASVLHACGREDRDIARVAALQREAITLDADLWIIGVAELSAVTREMIRVLIRQQAAVTVLVHAPASQADAFDDLGCVRALAWRNVHIPIADERLRVVEHPSNQAETAVAALARLDARYAADEITVAVPDPEVVPYLEQQIRANGIPARYAVGTPVEKTAPVQLLAAMADCVEAATPAAVAALLRHPDARDWLRNADVSDPESLLISLDRYMTERLPSDLSELPPATESGRDGTGAIRLIAGVLGSRLRSPLRGRRPVAAWMEPILSLLSDVYGEQELNRHIPSQRRLIRVFGAIREAASGHARLPEDMDDMCDAATAMRILLDDVHGQAVPLEAEERSIELLGWLEMHLDDAPVAVLTGMNDPFVPESVNAHAFLPDSLRARLGLDDNALRYARYAYQLTAMLHSRDVVELIAGRRSLLGDPLRPSRLLLTETGPALARRVRTFLRDPRNLHGLPDDDGVSSSFDLPPDRVIRFEPLTALSVTRFQSVISDPYVFILDHVLRLRMVEDAARELQPPAFGTFAHTVLQRFGESPEAHSADEEEVRAALDALLDACALERLGRAPLHSARVQVEQLRLRLHRFARHHAARVKDGWRTHVVEAKAEDVPFDVDGEPFRLSGRIDRIDYNERTGEWAVLDYKTGDRGKGVMEVHCRMKGGEIVDWKDLQLPLYRHLLARIDAAPGAPLPPFDAERVHFGYVLLCGEPDAVRFDLVKWSDAELQLADERARDVVRFLRSGSVTYEPRSSDWLDPDLELLLGRERLQAAEAEEEDLEAVP